MNTKRALEILDEAKPAPLQQVAEENKFYGFWGLVAAPLFVLAWLIALFHLGAYAADAYRHLLYALGF